MQHQFEYILKGKKERIVSSMAFTGEDTVNTAMSITVGLPVPWFRDQSVHWVTTARQPQPATIAPILRPPISVS